MVWTKALEGVEEAAALEEFEEGGGFAAGDDEAVEAIEFGRSADEFSVDAKGGECFGVGFECALEGKDAYGQGFGLGFSPGGVPLLVYFAQSIHNRNDKSGPRVF